jgi:hypothetical protein
MPVRPGARARAGWAAGLAGYIVAVLTVELARAFNPPGLLGTATAMVRVRLPAGEGFAVRPLLAVPAEPTRGVK